MSILIKSKPNIPYYRGVLIKKPVSECKIAINQPVITIEGDSGKIIRTHNNFWNKKASTWLDIKLDTKNYKHVKDENVFVVFVHIKRINKLFPLSHSCYPYLKIDDLNKKMKVRITNRGFAIFDSKIMEEREHVAFLRRSRYGASILQRLENSNFSIIKKSSKSWLTKIKSYL